MRGILGGSSGGAGAGGGGSGDVVSSAPILSGSTVTTANALAAFAIDVTKGLNTKTISADQSFTFSGAPASTNTWFTLAITNSDTASHVATIPSSVPEGQASTITSVNVPASSKIYLTWRYDGVIYQLFGVDTALGITLNSHSADYTLVFSDANQAQYHPSSDASARVFTIPANASVAYNPGTALTFVNEHGAGVLSIAITSDTMRLAGAGTTGTRTLAADGIATALKLTTTTWLINGTGLT